ncbi:glycosyltransferase [Schleiferiaceae bacterium]|nr:glycosyltransferase [Schleiferiaceae bacterium]
MILPKIKQPIFILGMHRSGTTMVTRALSEAGVHVGTICDHNSEALYAIDVNERIFQAAGGSWWSPPTKEAILKAANDFETNLKDLDLYGAHLKHSSGRRFSLASAYKGPWAVKDPRLCYTLSWWLARFPNAKVIWIFRAEEEIVQSLLRRQEIAGEAQSALTEETAQELVHEYNEAATANIKNSGVEVRMIKYNDLVSKDVDLQRKSWFSLYQFCKVRPGAMEGFTRRSPKLATEKSSKPSEALPTHGPLVSVIVPNYNHAQFLDERLQSIANQSYKNIEVLLMDDCSLDHSTDLLARWADRDTRMTTLFNDQNSGSPFAQWAKGAQRAEGKYVWIAESDDYCDTDMLALHVQSMEANEKAVIAYSHSHLVDEKGHFLRDFKDDYGFIFGDTAKWAKDFTISGKTEVAKHMVFSNTIPNASGILIRKRAFDAVGAPATHWRLNGDWLFYAKLLQHGELIFHAQPRNKFRFHSQTQRSRSMNSYKAFDELLEMYAIFQEEDFATLESINAARGQVAMWWAANVFSMANHAEVWRNNLRLYRSFKQYRPGLGMYLLKSGVIKIVGQFFIVLGLKKPIKKLAAKLFPKTFFAH